MIQDRSIITFSIIVAFLLFTAGCTSQLLAENQSVNASQNNSLSSPTIVKDQSQCPLQENKTYSIIRGESFVYSGMVPSSDIQSVKVLLANMHGTDEPILVPVNNDNTYNFSLSSDRTKGMGGIYHIILKNLIAIDRFDLILRNTTNETVQSYDKWIHINDPIADRYPDYKNFTFSGTTNLAAFDEISVNIHTRDFHPCQKYPHPHDLACGKGFNEIVEIKEGTCGINTWSFNVNTSEYYFGPEWYLLSVNSVNQPNNVWDIGLIRIVSRPT